MKRVNTFILMRRQQLRGHLFWKDINTAAAWMHVNKNSFSRPQYWLGLVDDLFDFHQRIKQHVCPIQFVVVFGILQLLQTIGRVFADCAQDQPARSETE